jgi:AcrR family transcriptional regulator
MKKTTKKEILKKSWDIFDRNSFFSLSMSEIALNLNIQKSNLYYYFKSKVVLFEEVIKENIKNIFSQFDIIFASDISNKKKIERLAKIYLNQLQNKSSVLKNTGDRKLDNSIISVVSSIEQKILQYFELIFSEGIKKGEFKKTDPKNLSLALLGYLDKININNNQPKNNWLDFLIN